MTALAYATLLDGRRLLPEAYTSQPTQPAQPALAGDVLAAALRARSERVDAMAALRDDLDATTGECVPPELNVTGYTGCHRTRRTAPADYWPTCVPIRDGLHERIRWYLIASGGTDTGVIPVVEAAR